jgi:beta-mannanase
VGLSTPGIGTNFDEFLSAVRLRRVALYNRWTEPNGSFDWILNEFAKRPVTGMISWNLPGDGTQASIAQGAWDANIRARAAEARAYRKPLFIRLNWEMNDFWYPWSARSRIGVARPGNAPFDYIAAWRHVVSLFNDVPNVTFVWCPNLLQPVPTGSGLTDWSWYPGDRYVGWIGVDAYPGSASWDWIEGGTQGLNAFDSFARQHGKPLMIAEWGLSTTGTGDSTWWMTTFLSWMSAHPSVKAQLYFDYDNSTTEHANYRLAEFPLAAAAYGDAMAGTRWLTRLTKAP